MKRELIQKGPPKASSTVRWRGRSPKRLANMCAPCSEDLALDTRQTTSMGDALCKPVNRYSNAVGCWRLSFFGVTGFERDREAWEGGRLGVSGRSDDDDCSEGVKWNESNDCANGSIERSLLGLSWKMRSMDILSSMSLGVPFGNSASRFLCNMFLRWALNAKKLLRSSLVTPLKSMGSGCSEPCRGCQQTQSSGCMSKATHWISRALLDFVDFLDLPEVLDVLDFVDGLCRRHCQQTYVIS